MLPEHLQHRFQLTPRTYAGRESEAFDASPFRHPDEVLDQVRRASFDIADDTLRLWLQHPDDRILDAIFELVRDRDPELRIRGRVFRAMPEAMEREAKRMRAERLLWTYRIGRLERIMSGTGIQNVTRPETNQFGREITRWVKFEAPAADVVAALRAVDDPTFDHYVGLGIDSLNSDLTAMLRARPMLLDGVMIQASLAEPLRREAWDAGLQLLARPQDWIQDDPTTPTLPQLHLERVVPAWNGGGEPEWKEFRAALERMLDDVSFKGLSPVEAAQAAEQISSLIGALPWEEAFDLFESHGDVPGVLRGALAHDWLGHLQHERRAVLLTARGTNNSTVARDLLLKAENRTEVARLLIDPTRTLVTAQVLAEGPAELADAAWQAILDSMPQRLTGKWYKRRGLHGVLKDLEICDYPPPWVLGELARRSHDSGCTLGELTRNADLEPDQVTAILDANVIAGLVEVWLNERPWYLYPHPELPADPALQPKLAAAVRHARTPEGVRDAFRGRLGGDALAATDAVWLIDLVRHMPPHLLATLTPQDLVPLLTHSDGRIRQRAQLEALPRFAPDPDVPPTPAEPAQARSR